MGEVPAAGAGVSTLASARELAATNPTVAAARFMTARELFRQAGEGEGVAHSSDGLWKLWMAQESYSRAADDIARELRYATLRRQHSYAGLAHGSLAWIKVRTGAVERAVAEFNTSITSYQAAGYGAGVAVSRLNLAELLRNLGRFEESLRLCTLVREAAEAEADQAMGAAAIAGQAASRELDDPVAAKLYKQAMAVYRSKGMDKHAGECGLRLATALQVAGDFKGAVKAATEAGTLLVKAGDMVDAARCGLRVASVQMAMLRVREAEPVLEKVQTLFDRIGRFDLSARCDIARAMVWDSLARKSHTRDKVARHVLDLMMPALLHLDPVERASTFAASRARWEGEQRSWVAWALGLAADTGDPEVVAAVVGHASALGVHSGAAVAGDPVDPFAPGRVTVLDRPAPMTIGHLLRSPKASLVPDPGGVARLLRGAAQPSGVEPVDGRAAGGALLEHYGHVARTRYSPQQVRVQPPQPVREPVAEHA